MVDNERGCLRLHQPTMMRRKSTLSGVVVGATISFLSEAQLAVAWVARQHTPGSISSDCAPTFLLSNNKGYADEEDDDDEPPDVDISNFRPPTMAYGLNKGRSSPSQRKAMGVSGSSTTRIHLCTTCGSEYVKWMGRCPTCKEWNTLQEHVVARQQVTTRASQLRPVFGVSSRSVSWLDQDNDGPVRITDVLNATEYDPQAKRLVVPGDEELNVVLGGGIVRGSLTLVGGDPGVGKSTLLLQMAGSIASMSTPSPKVGMGLPEKSDNPVGPVWYISGEETPYQIASRASRLGIAQPELFLLSETYADALCEQIATRIASVFKEDGAVPPKPPSLVVIDSIQTMVCDAGGSSAAGGITQVRECVALFLRLAKTTGIPIFLVGHVTKSGDVAGPRTVEHMVDCVLYLEGSDQVSSTNIRVLRASKNRFGSSDEVGVYEMQSGRLLPVSDPSSMFLAHRVTEEDAEGCAIAVALEGRRAMTVEVQALVTPAGGLSGFGRRTVDGIASSRLLLLLGVLQKRCGLLFSRHDIYINVAGRMRLDRGEGNAADLGVAIALVSSLSSISVRSDTAFVGEVGLLGELRSVPSLSKRLEEARRMGFSRVVTPPDGQGRGQGKQLIRSTSLSGVEWIQCRNLIDAINAGLTNPLPRKKQRRSNSSRDTMAMIDAQTPGAINELGLDEIMDDGDDVDFG